MASDSVFVFKQSYKPRNRPATKALNQKHITYIATRPGVMCNPESGFGLWGKLPGMDTISAVEDLRIAINAVGAASEEHTVYRAILSVDGATAQTYHLYDRSEWEKLLRSRISVIRSEMRIKPENFYWAAAMHYKKGHPHVHIVYWDAGKEPKQEHVSTRRFEEISVNVRAAFTGAIINSEEIHATLKESDATMRETQLRLRSLLKEANIPDALNLDHVKAAQRDSLGNELLELARSLPARGALKYAYLPQAYKERLDAYVQHVLEIKDFAKLEAQYAKLSEDVSRLYGNTDALRAEYQYESKRKLVEYLGNETLRYLKSAAAALRAEEPPEDVQALIKNAQKAAEKILCADSTYSELLKLLPRYRTPLPVLLKDKAIRAMLNEVAGRLSCDIRISSKVAALIDKNAAGKAAKAELRKEISETLDRSMRQLVWEKAQEDKGYPQQQRSEIAVSALLALFRGASQSKGQLQAQRDLQREKYRNLSETAKKDLRRRRAQASDWEPEL